VKTLQREWIPVMAYILVIDDEPQIRSMLRQMFEREGLDVMDAPDGNVAMKLLRKQPADIIVTDLIMPDKEGLETIMEIRQEFPQSKIIAISGGGRNDPKDYLMLAKKLGAARTFAKPVERKAIVAAVKELLAT